MYPQLAKHFSDYVMLGYVEIREGWWIVSVSGPQNRLYDWYEMGESATYPVKTERVVSEKVEAIINASLFVDSDGDIRIGLLILLYDLLQSAVYNHKDYHFRGHECSPEHDITKQTTPIVCRTVWKIITA